MRRLSDNINVIVGILSFPFFLSSEGKVTNLLGRAQQSDEVGKGEGGFSFFFLGLRRVRVDDKH